ncbi:hypothetical protein FACS18942_09940 [Planctomycetales bacterium]|nr:hypothetical protein FACS18942_09940 [Planctomycetales bacterium]
MDEFNKRACEAWTEWLTDLHYREELKRQRRNAKEAEQDSNISDKEHLKERTECLYCSPVE